MRRDSGFTMVELLVAVALMSVVVAAALQSAVVQNRAYTVVDQVTEAQQNGRVISELMEREIRASGFLVPEFASSCGIDQTGAPDTLFVTDADAIDPADQRKAELGAKVQASGPYATALGFQTLDLDDLTLETKAFYDNDSDGTPDADFREGAGVILADADNPGLGTACGTVDQVFPGSSQIRVNFLTQIGPIPLGDKVIVVPAHVYQVNAQLQLLRDGMVLAEGVEDLQVAWFIDLDGDGAMDANEDFGAGGGQPNYLARNRDHSSLREIRVNVAMRSRTPDPGEATGMPTFQATENRTPITTSDGYRRRVQTVTSRLRNLGARG
jgi:prepilin-type N-terminal cleavage/methylation domain-containing protein